MKSYHPGHIYRLLLLAFGIAFAGIAQGIPLAAKPAALPPSAADPVKPDSALEARRQRVLQLGDPAYVKMRGKNPKVSSYDILAATALKGCGPAEWSDYMASLSRIPSTDIPGDPVELFALPPLVRYLYQFGDCLTADQKQQLLGGLVERQSLTGGGTTNHAVMRASSWYLLAQYFPDANWTDADGKKYTSAQLMGILKGRLAGRTAQFYRTGHAEWLSPTYAMVDFYPLLNLHDFARDAEVRNAANSEATLELGVMRASSFHGVFVPPLTRTNNEQRNAPDTSTGYTPSVAQQVLWYYFGEPQMSDYDLQSRREPFYVIMLAQSAWAPPQSMAGAAGGVKGAGYALKVTTPEFGDWGKPTPPAIFGDSYIAEDFAIGTGNMIFDPAGYNDHNQMFAILLRSNSPLNKIECFQPYWSSNKGEDNWGTDRSSPFQQMIRYDGTSVVMLFDIPERDPWKQDTANRFFATRNAHADGLLQMFQCRIPRSFEQVVTEPQWVFIKQGNVFVAIATLLGTNKYDQAPSNLDAQFRIFKVREAKSALFFRVEQAREGYDFAEFQKAVRKKLPVYDKASSTVRFGSAQDGQTEVTFKLAPLQNDKRWASLPSVHRNGKIVPADSDNVIDSPLLSLRAGVMSINDGRSTMQLAAPAATK